MAQNYTQKIAKAKTQYKSQKENLFETQLKPQIIALSNEGKTYVEIMQILGLKSNYYVKMALGKKQPSLENYIVVRIRKDAHVKYVHTLIQVWKNASADEKADLEDLLTMLTHIEDINEIIELYSMKVVPEVPKKAKKSKQVNVEVPKDTRTPAQIALANMTDAMVALMSLSADEKEKFVKLLTLSTKRAKKGA